jgi:protease-4
VLCLAAEGVGRTYRLRAERPRFDRDRDLRHRADVIGPDGTAVDVAPLGPPAFAVVRIYGPLEQRAGHHDPCSGWTDGYDAIYERFCDAFEESDVLLVIDSPGGAVLGLPECVDGILRAKEAKGRKVTTVINGMAGSAGYWLASTLTDPGELYITLSSLAGSIGARSCHVNEAGALAMEGCEVTDFAYPPGKIALSPNRALSDVGKARGERDVMEAFDAFVSAVSSARPWLSRKAIVALDADMLTGRKAVASGLVDSLASVEEVEAWALARAGGDMEDPEKDKPGEGAGAGGGAPAEPEGGTAKFCQDCGGTLTPGAKFCASCGHALMAEDPEEDEGMPESSKPGATIQRGGTVASMLGLRPHASDAAIKAALAPVLAFRDHTIKALGATDLDSARGKLRATIEDAKQGVKAAKDVRALRAQIDAKERIDLCLRLANAGLPEFPRGNCVLDLVNDAGKAIGMEPGALFKHMPLAELRGFVAGKIENASPGAAAVERNPFEPDAKKAETSAGLKITEHDRQIAARTGSTPEQVASTRTALENHRRAMTGAPHGVS